MNTVQSETRRRCSSTPSLAALAVAAPPPLTPSRPQHYPPPHNARQRNTGHPRGQPPRHKPLPTPQARSVGAQLRSGSRGGLVCKAERPLRPTSRAFAVNGPLLHREPYDRAFGVVLRCSASHTCPVAPATSAARNADTPHACRHINPTCFSDLQMISPRVDWPG